MTSGADYGFGCVAVLALVGMLAILGGIIYGVYSLIVWLF